MSHQYIIRHDELPEPIDPPPAVTAAMTQNSAAALDSVLDEIDDVLQHNAETFVRSFVQKGGQ